MYRYRPDGFVLSDVVGRKTSDDVDLVGVDVVQSENGVEGRGVSDVQS